MHINQTSLLQITKKSLSTTSKLIGKFAVEPHNQIRLTLGQFTPNSHPKGFLVKFSPDSALEGSVVTQIIALGDAQLYKLTLHIANFDNTPISATVWQK